MNHSKSRTTFVGIGSSHGDDQAGWLVVERLQNSQLHDLAEFRTAKSPIDILDWLQDCEKLVICDACHGLGKAGQIHRFSWPSNELCDLETSGTHNLSLAAVLKLANTLNQLPDHVEIWVVEGKYRKANQSVSPEVKASIPQLVEQILKTPVIPGAEHRKESTQSA